jgi:hypothetical protein
VEQLEVVETGRRRRWPQDERLKTDLEIRRRLAEISTSFDDIERLRVRIDQGQIGIEGRIRDILRFIGRNPATIRECVEIIP